jgi:hypothetical protein
MIENISRQELERQGSAAVLRNIPYPTGTITQVILNIARFNILPTFRRA